MIKVHAWGVALDPLSNRSEILLNQLSNDNYKSVLGWLYVFALCLCPFWLWSQSRSNVTVCTIKGCKSIRVLQSLQNKCISRVIAFFNFYHNKCVFTGVMMCPQVCGRTVCSLVVIAITMTSILFVVFVWQLHGSVHSKWTINIRPQAITYTKNENLGHNDEIRTIKWFMFTIYALPCGHESRCCMDMISSVLLSWLPISLVTLSFFIDLQLKWEKQQLITFLVL